MVCFSKDVDIFKYEPALFGELYLPGQVLAEGYGGWLDGTTFTAAGIDFVGCSVEAGGVIYLKAADGSVDGAFEIVSVDSGVELTVSVVRAESQADAIVVGGAGDVSYRVVTYRPQAEEAGFRLTEYFGVKPGCAASDIDADDILDTSSLKRVSVFSILSSLYAMLGSEGKDDNFWKKSMHYNKLFEKAKDRCSVSIDMGSDGVSDMTIHGGSGRLMRD